jgi:ornithine carbamoyltransferase
VLYADIWVSMGTELESARREAELGPYWINESLVKLAKPEALDCLPAHRGQEIDAKVFEANAGTIFRSGREQAPLAESDFGKTRFNLLAWSSFLASPDGATDPA